jgi:uncharacterized protein YjbI with pentapeptide repeats
MSDADKPALRPANENPWYCLATLHGELPEEGEWRRKESFGEWPEDLPKDLDLRETISRNRAAWNRWVASTMTDEERASLVKNGFPPHELAPLSPEEESAFRQAYVARTGGGKCIWPLVPFHETLDFSFTHFDRPVTFAGFLFTNHIAKFQSATFSGRADFRSTRFGPAYFDSAIFSAASSFESATFSGHVAFFHSVTFAESASFKLATFSASVFFKGAQFSPSASTTFERATFHKEAHFDPAMFPSYTSFAFAKFNDRAEFASAKFPGYATFERVTFSRQTDFESAKFSHLNFEHATVDAIILFRSAKFSAEAEFNSAVFNSDARFDLAKFSSSAEFISATFYGYASFHSTVFKSGASFHSATFFHQAILINAKFGGQTLFSKTLFKNCVPDFHGASLHEGTEWHDARWPWPPNGRYAAQDQVYNYERLKQEMERLKKHDDELRFFGMELRARRGLTRPLSADWYLNFAYQASSNYGLSVWRPLVWLFVLFAVGWAAFYFVHATNPGATALTIPHAAALSFGNIFPFVPSSHDFLSETPFSGWSRIEKVIAVGQTLLGTPLLFLFGLAVRNRFRMR